MDAKDYFGINTADYSDEELMEIQDKLLIEHDKCEDEWADELAEITQESGFKENSFKGKRALKKLAQKYAEKFSDIEVIIDIIQDELVRRETYNEQQRYIVGGKYKSTELTDDDYLRRESEKNKRIRGMINIDIDDN